MDAFSARCTTLDEAWNWWATTLTVLDDEAWVRPTRLPGWDVAALAAHVSMLVRALRYLVTQPLDGPAGTESARDMLARFNAPGGVAATLADTLAEAAREDAASMSRNDLVAVFAATAPEVAASLEATGPIVIDYFGHGPFPIAEAMSIATMEAVVHGLDLAAAIGPTAAAIPADPMRHTVGLLAAMADPASFIDAATGRSAVAVLPVLR